MLNTYNVLVWVSVYSKFTYGRQPRTYVLYEPEWYGHVSLEAGWYELYQPTVGMNYTNLPLPKWYTISAFDFHLGYQPGKYYLFLLQSMCKNKGKPPIILIIHVLAYKTIIIVGESILHI